MTVVIEGPTAAQTRASLDGLELPVELRVTDAPVAKEEPSLTEWPRRVAAARTAWVSANFTECLQQLDDDAAVPALLAAHERLLASRILIWRTACHHSARHVEAARAAAESLAVFGLSLPEDVASMTPEVETLLARANTEVGSRARQSIHVASTPSGASVEVDGRPSACNTPCTVETSGGRHVIRLASDGSTPAWRVVDVSEVSFALDAASPELATAQWRRRLDRGDAIDSNGSVKLLSTSLRAPRLVVLSADPAAPGMLRGALAIDGELTTRAEREGDAAGLMRDLLVRGQVIEAPRPIYKSVPFWVTIGVAAIAAGVTTGVVLATQNPRTEVVLR